MREVIDELLTKVQRLCFRKSIVADFEGITLSDLGASNKKSPQFRSVLLDALQLLKATDDSRLKRVRAQLHWIVRTTLEQRGLAKYNHNLRACEIDFLEPTAEYDREWLVGWYACTLVHEATHGVIACHNVQYTSALRSRIERLCVKEERRFIERLRHVQPQLATRLHREFDESQWARSWQMSRGEKLRAQFRRSFFPKEGE